MFLKTFLVPLSTLYNVRTIIHLSLPLTVSSSYSSVSLLGLEIIGTLCFSRIVIIV